MNPDSAFAARAGARVVRGRPSITGSNVVSMAILFGAVKRQVQAAKLMEQRTTASLMEGGRVDEMEHRARSQNLDRMRQQTKSQLALSMGMSPVLMGGGLGTDPTTAAHITQAQSQGRRLGMV